MPEGEGEPSLAAADTLTSPRAGRLIRLDDFAYVRRIRRWEPHACDCPAPAPPAGSPLILSRPSMKQCRTPLEKREVPGAANSGMPSRRAHRSIRAVQSMILVECAGLPLGQAHLWARVVPSGCIRYYVYSWQDREWRPSPIVRMRPSPDASHYGDYGGSQATHQVCGHARQARVPSGLRARSPGCPHGGFTAHPRCVVPPAGQDRQLKSRARPSASDLDPDAKSQWGACAALGNARVGAEYLNPSGTKGLIGPGTFVLNTCSCNWP
jgi:hypothetical protein